MKVLVATDKPFAPVAIEGIRSAVETAGHQLALLEKYGERGKLLAAVADADALIIRSDVIDAQVMNAAPHLRIIVRAGAGYDNVDLAAATERGICVMNTPGQNSNAVAELAFGLMVMAARHFYDGTSGSELKGKTLGIHAYGNVGRNVARIARGFGMQIQAYDTFPAAVEAMKQDGVMPVDNVEQLYATSHIVSLHIPANEQTRASIGHDLVARMPRGGILVNTARKEVIDEDGLLTLLDERTDLTYLTDIRPERHANFEHVAAGRYFATPKKMGAQTAEANINAGIAAARQIVAYFNDGCEQFRVNR